MAEVLAGFGGSERLHSDNLAPSIFYGKCPQSHWVLEVMWPSVNRTVRAVRMLLANCKFQAQAVAHKRDSGRGILIERLCEAAWTLESPMIMKPQLALLTFAVALAASSCSTPKTSSANTANTGNTGDLELKDVIKDVTVTFTPHSADDLKRLAENDRYFKYPRAALVAKWNMGINIGSCSMELSRNFSHVAPDPDHPESAFRSGCGFGNGDGIFYEFVRKTEHGDVYLLKRGLPGPEQMLTPVLFAGEPLTVVAKKDLQVQILAAPPQAAK